MSAATSSPLYGLTTTCGSLGARIFAIGLAGYLPALLEEREEALH